jgi:diguanylate cyclase (GGDEF)-like protein/PAS domain S-box-containing protein
MLFYQYYVEKNIDNQLVAKQIVSDDAASAGRLISTIIIKMVNAIDAIADNRLDESVLLSNSDAQRSLENSIVTVMAGQKYLSKVVFTNSSGDEKIRIENNAGIIVSIPKELHDTIANKADMAELSKLQPGNVSVNGIKLETHFDEVVQPYNPIIKVTAPIYSDNVTLGYLVGQIDLLTIKKEVELHTRQKENFKFILNDGSISLDSDIKKIFGHQIDENSKFNIRNIYPKLWEDMNNIKMGSYLDENIVAAYRPVILPDSYNVEETTLLIILPIDTIVSKFHLSRLTFPYIFSVVPLTILMIWVLFYLREHRKKSVQKSLANVALNSVSAVIITDKNVNITMVNDRFIELSGYAESDIIGRNPSMFASRNRFRSKRSAKKFYQNMWHSINNEGQWEGELLNNYNGEDISVIARIVTIIDQLGNITNYAASYIDISKQKKLEQQLLLLSEKDALTQCWNRRKYDRELERYCNLIRRYPQHETISLAVIDIDLFKTINDQQGHDKGDEVIQGVSDCLKRLSRETDLVARIGGEEFAIIMPNTKITEAIQVIERMCHNILAFFDAKVTVSVGITDLDHELKSSFRRADRALYASKSKGRQRITIESTNAELNRTIFYHPN